MQELSKEEQAVFDLINSNERITQWEISKSEKWLGCHHLHEEHLNFDKSASTLRKIRQIVRDMRLKKGVAILSDKQGYFIMKSKEEADEYIKRIERTAKSQASSWHETYSCMSKLFGIKNEYFEANKIKVREHTRRIKKDTPPSTPIQDNLF